VVEARATAVNYKLAERLEVDLPSDAPDECQPTVKPFGGFVLGALAGLIMERGFALAWLGWPSRERVGTPIARSHAAVASQTLHSMVLHYGESARSSESNPSDCR